jgi:hypothetical protein
VVEVRGSATSHTADGHLGLPRALDRGVRPTHRQQTPKPTGLDWSAIAPPCSLCGRGSSELRDGMCPLCRGVAPTPKDQRAKVSKGGDSVFVSMADEDVERRYEQQIDQADEGTPCPKHRARGVNSGCGDCDQPEPEASAAEEQAPLAPVERPAAVGADVGSAAAPNPSSAAGLDEPAPGGPSAAGVDDDEPDIGSRWYGEWLAAHLLLEREIAHITEVMVEARKSTDEAVRLLRENVLRSVDALHALMEALRPPAEPVDEPVAGGFVPFERSRRRCVFDDEAVGEAYRAGRSMREIAREIGVSQPTIAACLDRLGIQRRPRGGQPSRPKPPRVGGTAAVDAAKADLLDELGVAAWQVKEWAVEAGLIPVARTGRVSRALIEAYADAHRTEVTS